MDGIQNPYVFISYASDDWEMVFKSVIVPLQKQYGLRVYADKAFDRKNSKWTVEMQRNINGAAMVLVFVSQAYIESYACFLELFTAAYGEVEPIFLFLKDRTTLEKSSNMEPLMVEAEAKKMILRYYNNNKKSSLFQKMKDNSIFAISQLEEDGLSKSDISDTFIKIFHDASVNEKSADDLEAIKDTISSVNSRVFDGSLVLEDELVGSTAQGYAQEQKPIEPFRQVPGNMNIDLYAAEHGDIDAILKVANFFFDGKRLACDTVLAPPT